MKKAIKIFGIILLVIVTLIVITFFVLSHVLKSALGDNWEDFSKIFTMQSGENLPPLENVVQRTIDVKFINKDGIVETRPIRLYLPEQAQPTPTLVYVPHYEIAEDSAELRRYLAKGWAVASPTAFDNAYNGELTDDDLVFNNAALYTLALYRQEVGEELGQWAENHSLFELDTAMREAVANAEERGAYLAAWEEIKSVLE